ncbi:MAG: Uma2 family endonuclease [Alphaproteobacteria bacterium]|nr:Uma2 family endonuclease [Alphaproteobacteria bacterium]
MNRLAAVPAPVDYPCSDGKPLAESDFQLKPLVYAITALQTHFLDRAQVYVAGDMFVYFKEGDPGAVVAPDVFVVLGAPKHMRSSYKLWEEPKAPDFVLEVTSRSTRAEDEGRKREVYASLGVAEYWLFDPTGDWLAPRLQGFRLRAGGCRALQGVALAGGGLGVHSEALGLDVRHDEDGRLRFHDPASGEDLPAHEEMREQVEQEIGARRAAEARLGEEVAAHRATRGRLEEEIAARDTHIAELEARLRSAS